MDLGDLIVNTIFYTLGIIAGTIMRHIDIAVEWFADGYARGRDGLPVWVEPPKV